MWVFVAVILLDNIIILATQIEQYIIDRVKVLRTERGISQTELAYSIGVTKGFIAAVENPNQRAKYNINHLNELAKVFDCQFADFFPPAPFE